MGKIDDIALFVAIAQAGGFAAAESSTGLPRSTLSKRLAGLEKKLGVQLAKRSPQSFALTPEGESFFGECKPAFDRIRAAEDGVVHSRDQPTGLVRVTAPAPIAHGLLAVTLPAFFAAHPEIWVSIDVTGIKVDLATASFDIAIRVGDVEGDDYVARQLFEECEALYASPSYLENNYMPKKPSDLGGHRAILCSRVPPQTAMVHWPLIRDTDRIEVAVPLALHVNDAIMALSAALAGVGIASLPRFVAQADVANGNLIPVLPEWCSPSVIVRAVLPHRPKAATRVFLNHVIAVAKKI